MERLKHLAASLVQWGAAHPRLIAFAAGMMAATGFAPLKLWPLTLIGLAMLMRLVAGAPHWRAAAAHGWFWGCGHFILNLNWIAKAFIYQDNMPHWLGWVAVVGLAAFLALFVGAVGGVSVGLLDFFAPKTKSVHPVSQRVDVEGLPLTSQSVPKKDSPSTGSGRTGKHTKALPFTLIFTACWIISEYARATMLTGFAWDPIGVVLLGTGLDGGASIVGTYGLACVIIVGASVISFLSLGQWRSGVASFAVFMGLWLVFGTSKLDNSVINSINRFYFPTLEPRITIIQPNIPEDIGNDSKQNFNNLIKHMRLSGAPDPNYPRLILWPEGSLTDFVEDEPWARERLAQILGPHDILAAGGDALVFDDQHHLKAARNSIFLINAKAEIIGRYDKAHLVPGGEYLPMRAILSLIGLNRLVPGDLDFLPGPGPRTLNVPGFGKMGGLICYEVIFSGEVVDAKHRPDFIFNPSTDAWFGDWGPPQHLAQAQMRALEEGIPIIRATTTGISAVIDANGEIVTSQPLNIQGALVSAIPPAAPPTFFSQYGNTIPLMLAALLGAIGIALARRRR